uniref:Lipoprotein n=1 Tax=Strongyloides papillosus TaxID=174720 RepID=A0A0N5BJ65_STREA
MIKYILSVLIFPAFLISFIFSCGAFLCAPFSNSATIVYNAEPSPSLTYSTNVSRVSGQYPTAASLAGSLQSTAFSAINSLATQARSYLPLYFTYTVTVSQNGLLNANVIPQICPDNNQRTIAAAGTHFVQNNKVFVRLQPENCTNGNLQTGLSSPALTTINYTINFRTSTGLRLCYSHWMMIANAIQSRLENDTRSTFLGNGVITSATV